MLKLQRSRIFQDQQWELHISEQKSTSDSESSENILNISIPGTPITKLRPRFSRSKGHVRTYDSQSAEKQTTKFQLMSRLPRHTLFEGPLDVRLAFVFPWPKSWPKKRRPLYHINKPDIDNLIKYILDIGNGVIWHDDTQVSTINATKQYGEIGSTKIIVRKIGE